MTLRSQCEKAAEEALKRCVPGDWSNNERKVADALEATARQYAASALVHARCSCGESEGFYENGRSALSKDEQTEALLSAERDL